MFAAILSSTGVSQFLSDMLTQSTMGTGFVILVMMIVGLFLGMFMDSGAVIMIAVPVFAVVAQNLGMDLLWFSLIFTVCATIGFITPPFAMNLFVLKGIAPPEIGITIIYKSVWPFVGIAIGALVIFILCPSLSLWLPSLMK